MCQVPAPSAVAWLVDLGEIRGARLAVLRAYEQDVRDAVAAHLVEIQAATAGDSAADCEPLGIGL